MWPELVHGCVAGAQAQPDSWKNLTQHGAGIHGGRIRLRVEVATTTKASRIQIVHRIDFMLFALAQGLYDTGFYLEPAERRESEMDAACVGCGVIELQRHVRLNDGQIAKRASERR